MQTQSKDPEALAGASGADIQDWLVWIDDNLNREKAARHFAVTVARLAPEDRLAFLEIAHEAIRAGCPSVPFGSVMDEARDWADWASPSERKAYALACFNRMPSRDQSAFLEYVQGRRAA